MANLVEHDDFTFLQVYRSSQLMMITISNDTQAQYIWRLTLPNSWNGQTMMIIVIKQNMYINFYNWRSTLPNYSSSNGQTMMITVTKHKQNISTPIWRSTLPNYSSSNGQLTGVFHPATHTSVHNGGSYLHLPSCHPQHGHHYHYHGHDLHHHDQHHDHHDQNHHHDHDHHHHQAKQSGSAASFNCTGAVRKAGFLSVKKWLLRKKHQVTVIFYLQQKHQEFLYQK